MKSNANASTWSKLNNTLLLSFAISVALLFFLSYLLPEWYTIHINQLNFFTNAWDEANYLTHQMAAMQKFSPSYWFGADIYLALENLGLSGSWQNVLFDNIVIPFIFTATVYAVKKVFNLSLGYSIVFALLICFASILFSYANQLIGNFFSYKFPDDKSFLVAAEISFPAILRAPYPLFSYFAIIVAILFYLRYKNWFILLVPLPFLYLSVFNFYFYIVVAFITYQFLSKPSFWVRIVLANTISSFLTFSLFLVLAQLQSVQNMLHFSELMNVPAYQAAHSHHFQLPLIFVIFFCLLPVLIVQKQKRHESLWFFYLTFLFSLLVCSNTHLLSGIMYAPKIFQSFSGTILASIMLVMLLYPVKDDNYQNKSHKLPKTYYFFSLVAIGIVFLFMSRLFLAGEIWGEPYKLLSHLTKMPLNSKVWIIFLPISIGILLSYLYFFRKKFLNVLTISLILVTWCLFLEGQGFSLADRSLEIKKYSNFTEAQLQLLKNKSPFVLITGPDAVFYSQYLPYAIPKMYSPLQSGHYSFLPFIQSCDKNLIFFKDALTYARTLPETAGANDNLLKPLESNISMSSIAISNLPIKFTNLGYCNERPTKFYVIDIKEKIQSIKLKIF